MLPPVSTAPARRRVTPRQLVGVVLAGALVVGGSLSACSAGKAPAPQRAVGAARRPLTPHLATAPPSALHSATVATSAPDAGPTEHDAAALLEQRAVAAAKCDSPRSTIDEPPQQGVVFNNAMTSVDAGFIDRTQGILDAIHSRALPLRCCFDAGGSHGELVAMVDMTLTPAGPASRVALSPQSSAMAEVVRACVIGVLRATSYPPSPTHKETIVRYRLKVRQQGPPSAGD